MKNFFLQLRALFEGENVREQATNLKICDDHAYAGEVECPDCVELFKGFLPEPGEVGAVHGVHVDEVHDQHTTDQREVVLWSANDDGPESLIHKTADDAFRAWWDDMAGEPTPLTIHLYGFARMKVVPSGLLARDLVEQVLESLDEEYGDPDGYDYDLISREETTQLVKLGEEFVDKVVAVYQKTSWACEVVVTQEINVVEWARRVCGEKLEP